MYKKFEYHEPKSISEAVSLLEKYPHAKILNGGTDVVVRLNQNICAPVMVNIKCLPELDRIEEKADGIHIGALIRHITISESQLLQEKVPTLVEAVNTIGTPQVRNRGTLSGNICNASPVADSMSALMILDATVIISGAGGERKVPISEFQTGPGKTVLNSSELVKEIVIPVPKKNFYGKFCKLGPRKTADIAIVNAAAGVIVSDGVCVDVRIALGAVAPKVIFAEHAQDFLKGKKLSQINIEKAAQIAASEDASPISDFRSSKEYRSEMVQVLVERALLEVIQKGGAAK